jgi:hypothetical protein
MLYHDDVEGLTRRLKDASATEDKARLWEDLFPKLKRIAQNRISAAGRRGQDSPTELVLDIYPGLQRAIENSQTHFESRAHFLAYAAQAMRRLMAARAKRIVAEELLDEHFAVERSSPALAIAMNEALDILSERFPRAVRAYQLREYGGYSREEILELMSADYRTKALLSADLTLVRKSLVELLRSDD